MSLLSPSPGPVMGYCGSSKERLLLWPFFTHLSLGQMLCHFPQNLILLLGCHIILFCKSKHYLIWPGNEAFLIKWFDHVKALSRAAACSEMSRCLSSPIPPPCLLCLFRSLAFTCPFATSFQHHFVEWTVLFLKTLLFNTTLLSHQHFNTGRWNPNWVHFCCYFLLEMWSSELLAYWAIPEVALRDAFQMFSPWYFRTMLLVYHKMRIYQLLPPLWCYLTTELIYRKTDTRNGFLVSFSSFLLIQLFHIHFFHISSIFNSPIFFLTFSFPPKHMPRIHSICFLIPGGTTYMRTLSLPNAFVIQKRASIGQNS